jgi:hypothetical protein
MPVRNSEIFQLQDGLSSRSGHKRMFRKYKSSTCAASHCQDDVPCRGHTCVSGSERLFVMFSFRGKKPRNQRQIVPLARGNTETGCDNGIKATCPPHRVGVSLENKGMGFPSLNARSPMFGLLAHQVRWVQVSAIRCSCVPFPAEVHCSARFSRTCKLRQVSHSEYGRRLDPEGDDARGSPRGRRNSWAHT